MSFITLQIRPWPNPFNPLPRELYLNCAHRLACASGRGWGMIRGKRVTCPSLALCTAFAPPLLFPTTPLAVRACAKGGKWAVLKRFRAVFFQAFPPRVLTLSNPKHQTPCGVYLYWLVSVRCEALNALSRSASEVHLRGRPPPLLTRPPLRPRAACFNSQLGLCPRMRQRAL